MTICVEVSSLQLLHAVSGRNTKATSGQAKVSGKVQNADGFVPTPEYMQGPSSKLVQNAVTFVLIADSRSAQFRGTSCDSEQAVSS